MWAGTPPRPPPAQAPRGGNAPAVKHSRALVRGRAATPGARLADAECFTSTSSSLQVGQQLLRRWLGRPETSPRGRNDRPARARPSCAALHAPGPPTAGAHRFSLPQHRHRAAHPPFYDAADRPRRGGHVDVPGVAAAAHSLGAARSGTLDTKPASSVWPFATGESTLLQVASLSVGRSPPLSWTRRASQKLKERQAIWCPTVHD